MGLAPPSMSIDGQERGRGGIIMATTITAPEIREGVRRMFDRVAATPGDKYRFAVGPGLARAVGYPEEVLASLPAVAVEPFTGLAYLHRYLRLVAGERVLDLGSGGGMDSLLAARAVEPNGAVIGLDLSETMVERARHLANMLQADHVRFQRGEAEAMPFADEAFDVAYANGLLNLCPDKPAVVSELRRVLKPGGRVVIAEITFAEPLPSTDLQSVHDWFR
jgi:arsenite methyltransferase